jgi:hypothetical protein
LINHPFKSFSIANQPPLQKFPNWHLTCGYCYGSWVGVAGESVPWLINFTTIMPRGDSYYVQGQQGGVVLTGADSAVGKFRWIQAIEDSVLLTDADETAGNLADIINLDGKTLIAGMGIGGEFTKVEISSGTVIAYYA